MKARKLLMIPGPMNQRVLQEWEWLNESCGPILLKFSETVLSL
jgi:hypothetical protein